jgi:hypothetical protein
LKGSDRFIFWTNGCIVPTCFTRSRYWETIAMINWSEGREWQGETGFVTIEHSLTPSQSSVMEIIRKWSQKPPTNHCWESDRKRSKISLNPSSHFLSSSITRCILRCMEPIKLFICPMLKFSHFSVRVWISSHCHFDSLGIYRWRYILNSFPFCWSFHPLINKLSQPPYRSIGSGTDLNGSSCPSTYSSWLPQYWRGFLTTRDLFGSEFRNKRTEDRPTSANKKFWWLKEKWTQKVKRRIKKMKTKKQNDR